MSIPRKTRLEPGMILTATYRGTDYVAYVLEDGKIMLPRRPDSTGSTTELGFATDRVFPNLTAAAKHIATRGHPSGWQFWTIQEAGLLVTSEAPA